MRLHPLLPLSHHPLMFLRPVTPLTLLLFLPKPPSPFTVAGNSPDIPPPVVVTSPPGPQPGHSAPHSEFGPPRLTRFLEMPLDRYVNIVTAMVNDGRFNHVGHGVLRLEGQTAWGV